MSLGESCFELPALLTDPQFLLLFCCRIAHQIEVAHVWVGWGVGGKVKRGNSVLIGSARASSQAATLVFLCRPIANSSFHSMSHFVQDKFQSANSEDKFKHIQYMSKNTHTHGKKKNISSTHLTNTSKTYSKHKE